MSKKTLLKQVLFGRIQRYIWLCLFLVAFSFLSTFFNGPQKVEAATSSTMNFQARLLQSSGALVPDGYYNVEFKLYNAQNSSGSSAGSCTGDSSCVWTETYKQANRVRVANGYLTVNLGAIQAFSGSINWDQEHWLTMNIGGTTNTASPSWDGEMTPRLKLTAVPHAFTAGKLQKTNGSNTSTLSFDDQTASRNILLPDESGKICLQGSTNCGFVSGSAGDFIQNSTSPQTANFNVSGNGTIGGTLSVPTIDRATAGTLSIGTTTATAVTIGRMSGTVNVAGGNINLQGNTAVSAGNSLTVSSGELAITGRSSGSNTTLRVNNHTSTGSIFVAQDAATDVFVIADGGSVLSKTSSTTGFQIQNANATSNLFIADTQNTRIGIGAIPANSLLTIGTNTINAAGGITFGTDTSLYRGGADTLKTDDTFDALAYKVNGTSGMSATCSAGQVLQNQVVIGGIVTGGTCATGGASGLQGAYDGGNTITTSDARDISFTLADTATDGNFLVNVASGSTGRFAIQSNGTDTFSVGPTGNSTFAQGVNVGGNLNVNGSVSLQNTTDSASAFQVQNSSGNQVFNVDTLATSGSLISNASIETDTAGWAAKGSATLTRSTAQKYAGNASLQIGTTVAAGDGAKYNVTLAPSTLYGLSLYARKTVPPDLTAFEVGYSADGSTDTSCSPSGTIVSGGWSRITCTFATPSSVSGSYIYIKKTNTTGQTIFIDAVQLSSVNNFPYYSGAISLQAPVTSTALFMSNVNSTTAFQIQNAGGNSDLFIANTVSNKIGIGVVPSNSGARLQVAGDIDIQGGLLRFNGIQLSSAHLLDNVDLAKLSASQTFAGNNTFNGLSTFQASSGSSLIVKESSTGINQNILAVNTRTDSNVLRVVGYGSGTDAAIYMNAMGSGALSMSAHQGLMSLTTTGVTSDIRLTAGRYVDVASQFQSRGSGDGTEYGALFRNNNNSTTAFAIQNAASSNVFVVNTTSGSIGINKTPNTTFSLDVSGNVNFANNMTVGAVANISNAVNITNPSLNVGQYTKYMTAGTGGVSQFDVVVLDSNGNVVKTTVPRNPQVYGVVPNGISATATGAVAIAGNITVNVDTAAVAVGDQLVTSSTAGRATVDNSATTGIIGTALSIKAAGSNGTVSMAIRPVGGQYAPKFRNAVDSSNGFQIQKSDGSNMLTADTENTRILMGSATSPTLSSAQLVVTVTEVQTTLRVGNATNGFSFNDTTTGESGKLRLYGTARNTKKVVLTPEYAGAVLSNTASACGGSDTGMGAMTAGFDTVATPNKNYYKWTSTQANCQSYDLIIQVSVPSDWSAWAASNAFSVDGWSDNLTNSTGNATAIGSNGTTDVNATSITPGATSTWTTTSSSLNSAHYTADGIMTIKLRMTAANNSSFRLGNVTLTYLSKF